MPIKLNPCAKCGDRPFEARETVTNVNGIKEHYTVSCCDTSISRKTREEADAAWNAANPKEGKPNE